MNYNGSRICPEGRKIEIGEQIVVNYTGDVGTVVVDRLEGEYVFKYYIKLKFDDSDKVYECDTDKITPMGNP